MTSSSTTLTFVPCISPSTPEEQRSLDRARFRQRQWTACCGADNERVATLDLHSGSQFRIGRTVMRYCNVDHPLAPTILDRENGESRLASPYALAGAGMVVLLVLCLESYLSSNRTRNLRQDRQRTVDDCFHVADLVPASGRWRAGSSSAGFIFPLTP